MWEDLSAMVYSRDLICANSTFSFTASLVGSANQRITVPNPWFANTAANRQLELWKPGSVEEIAHRFAFPA
jgi:hypothetical protein